MNITSLTTTNGADQFYPTPEAIAEKMLDGIDWNMVKTVLEPSVGKGDLVMSLARKRFHELTNYLYGSYNIPSIDVDAVEIDPYLREICKYNFSEAKKAEFLDVISRLNEKSYSSRTASENSQLEAAKKEESIIDSVDLKIVHDDFMTYRTHKKYDLIIMNPPFADGDMHLIKALEMQRDGGTVVCLLNAETILNPYTKTREVLKGMLQEMGAEVTILKDAFSTGAERTADVDVALVRVTIPKKAKKSTLFERMEKAAQQEYEPDAELHAMVPADFIGRAVCSYNAEVAAVLSIAKEYEALKPYLLNGETCLQLSVYEGGHHKDFSVNKYLQKVRLKYWVGLFRNEEFMGRMTTNIRKMFNQKVDELKDYEFSEFNIKQIMVEMNAEMRQGVEDTINDLFEKLTVEHSYYPEFSKNRHYFNGWKTNQAHKIGKKSIIPANGLFSSYSWDKDKFYAYAAYEVLIDIEKAFNYLDGGEFDGQRYDLRVALDRAEQDGNTRNVDCTYFKVDMFKKGTVHIKFRPEAMPLVDRLNIHAARGRNWLPPRYGKAAYSEMDAEEKAVVDGLNGDGKEGSGEKAYKEIMRKQSYYLADVAGSTLAITG